MKKQLQVKGYWNELGDFEVTHVFIEKCVAKHDKNKHLKLKEGYIAFGNEDSKCKPPCKAADHEGYYDCIGGTCIFFPTP